MSEFNWWEKIIAFGIMLLLCAPEVYLVLIEALR